MALPEIGKRVRVASQNSQFRKVLGTVVAQDTTSYTDVHGATPPVTVGPFAVVQPDGASPHMTARFTERDLVVLN